MAQAVLQSSSVTASSSVELPRTSARTSSIFGSQWRFVEIKETHFRLSRSSRSNSALRLKALREPAGLTQEITIKEKKSDQMTENECDPFRVMKNRFMSFKKDKYLKNLEDFQKLAQAQTPEFMVVACADSRVCPSSILGFQPGEAFVIRNVANLVPPFQNGPTETNAALEFAVNSLEVKNILVVGHSCCGGIRALMSMEEDKNSSSFIMNWVSVGNPARLTTKAATSKLNFDQQCQHCEKESIKRSLLNLLTYPWIKEKVKKGVLAIHGGYYDFVECTFEKWTLDYEKSCSNVDGGYVIKNHEIWN